MARRRTLAAVAALAAVALLLRSPRAPPPPAPRPCGPAPGPLELPAGRGRGVFEVTACAPLGLAYVHPFKSGGTALHRQLARFCRAGAGAGRDVFTSGAHGGGLLPPDALAAACASPGWTCYAGVRDPVDRFLSGFHYAMALRADPALRPFRLPQGAPRSSSIAALLGVLALKENRTELDSHLLPQSAFLPRPGAPLAAFNLSHADEALRPLLCRAHACFWARRGASRAPDCPYERLERSRSKGARDALRPQYDIKASELSRGTIDRIAALFAEDYCRFSLPKHPSASRAVDCTSPS
ncbi:hypothetical protein DFJ74DRAFT_224086 [Hyaloraphidium curvatum]|nr:hypothetical protein DFJ74DRAFT_224086 [Hyaloraphidium curvatum]